MSMICTWGNGKDGALVLRWERAADLRAHKEHSALYREVDGFDPADAFKELDRDMKALTPIGV